MNKLLNLNVTSSWVGGSPALQRGTCSLSLRPHEFKCFMGR